MDTLELPLLQLKSFQSSKDRVFCNTKVKIKTQLHSFDFIYNNIYFHLQSFHEIIKSSEFMFFFKKKRGKEIKLTLKK